MNLRYRIPLLIGITLTLLITALFFTLRFIQVRSVTALEEREVGRNLERIQDAVNNELNRLASTASDYATWDDTYRYMHDRNPTFIKENVTSENMINLKIGIFAIFDLKGDLVFGMGINPSEGTLRPMLPSEKALLVRNAAAIEHKSLDSRKSGIAVMADGILMFGSRPVITSNYEGPIAGTLLMAKYLDSAEIARLGAITHLDFSLHALDASGKDPDCPVEAVARLNAGARFVSFPEGPDSVLGFTQVRDISGKPALLLKLSSGREVYRQGLKTLRFFTFALILIGLFFIILVLLLLETQVLRRLSRLMQDVRVIKSSRSLQSRITLKGKDEIAGLSEEINRMLDSLEKSGVEIRESEKKFRLTFESSKNAILWIDADSGVIINCNREAERLFDRTKLDLIGQPQAALFPTGHAPSETRKSQALSEKDEGLEIEAEIATGTGAARQVIISTSVTSFGGKRLIQDVYRDVTRERKAEKERHELEEQLRQSQKMEVIGQLAGGVAHDFNNMLAGISGYSDLIRRKFGTDNPVLQRYAGTIFDTAKNAAELTAKLLAFARKGKHELVVVSIHEIIQDVVKLLEHSIDKRIIITQYLRAASAGVLGDRTQIQNAVLNLAMNACDAMPHGGELSFATENTVIDEAYIKRHPYKLVEGNYVMLAVTDSGIGMDDETRAKLFEPFFTTKAPGKGTGLGLASVYGTVKSHNGSIEVYSEPGKGSSFKIYLPLVDKQGGRVAQPHEKILTGTGRILLVDDEKLVRDVTSDILTELGYTVTAVTDGREAVDFYKDRQSEIDVVVLDIIMPRMGGYDCFVELKKINPGIRVVISSGYSMNNEAARIMNSGACGFVSKPFDIGKLSKAINDALKKS